MLDHSFTTLAFVVALGSGIIGGVFYAFSTFVMKALARLSPGEGIAVMQSINIAVINPLFLGVFMGTALAGLAVIVGAIVRWERAGAAWLAGGATAYIVGTFLVTIACNVPLNDALARVERDAPEAAERWHDYVERWTFWNHVRTTAAVAAMGALMIGLRQ